MLFDSLSALCIFFVIFMSVECRDIGKAFKAIPTITNSLVNLGKMDVSIYLNAKDSPIKRDGYSSPASTYLYSKSEPVEEPCPCSSLREYKDSRNPSDLLSKLLMSNDLFSYKEPTSSTLCCDSHEHDEFVTFELGSKHWNANPIQNSFSGIPSILNSLLSQKPLGSSLPKTKAVEIFFFPKKRESFYVPTKNAFKKDSIQIVGDKELKNDFASNAFKPSEETSVSSVKKDLTAQERNKMNKIDMEDIKIATSATNTNVV